MTDKLSERMRAEELGKKPAWLYADEVAALEADNTALRKRINDPGGAWADLERKLEIAEQQVERLERVSKFLLGVDSDTSDTDWQQMFKMAQREAALAAEEA